MKKQTIKVFAIGKSPSGHGHYRIYIEYNVNGVFDTKTNEDVTFTTTDMQRIDEWNEGGAESLAGSYLLNNVDSEAEIIFDF